MDLNNFQKQISSVTLQKGKQYYDMGAVVTLEYQESGFWYAEVKGSELYAVHVELSGSIQIEGYRCDCPHDNQVCKHIVAVLYELRDHARLPNKHIIEEDTSLLQTGQNRDVVHLVSSLKTDDLKEFVTSQSSEDQQVASELVRVLQRQDTATNREEQYTQQIREATQSTSNDGLIDGHAASRLARKLDGYLQKAGDDFFGDNFKDAYLITRLVIQELVGQIIPEADDSDGHLQKVLSDALALIKMLALSPRCNEDTKRDIHRYLANAFEMDDYFTHGDFGEGCFEVFRHLSAELDESELFLALCDGNIVEPGSLWIDNYRTALFTKQKIAFFQHIGDIDQALKLINESLHIADIRHDYINSLIEDEDYQQAKALIDEGLILASQANHAGTIFSLQKRLLEIADLELDVAATRRLSYLLAFEDGFNPTYYLIWKHTFSDQQWQGELAGLVENIVGQVEIDTKAQSGNHWWSKNQALLNKLAPIYIEEKLWYPLFKLVQAYPSLDTLLMYMQYLASDYPTELSEMLYTALILAGDRADSRFDYAQIASSMRDAIRLMPASKPQILRAAQELRHKYPERVALLDELRAIRQ